MVRALLALMVVAGAEVSAHPVPRENHDRFIRVRLQKGERAGHLRIRVDYRLEVDELTVVQDDMRPFRDQVDPALFLNQPLKFYGEYTALYGPIFAENLLVRVNDRELSLKLVGRQTALVDEKGEKLGHLRCSFVFEAEFAAADKENRLWVRETSFREQAGEIQLTLVNETTVKIVEQAVPDPAWNKVHFLERPAGFEDRLRTLTATLVVEDAGTAVTAGAAGSVLNEAKETIEVEEHEEREFLELMRWFRTSEVGFGLFLLMCAGVGAAHALTPGHGKTLVAAYLVGERGTVWHALVLGLVTTLTHTGVVLVLAAILFFLPDTMSEQARQTIQTGLGLAMGVAIVCLGFWLLLQRLAGGHDHIHLGGGHHHHHHDHDHRHDHESGAEKRTLGWGGIILLGMTGGIIPCWDAIALFAAVVGTSEFWLALPALLAFSAGLAGVLVAIGILVVQFRNFAGSRLGEGPVIRALPIVSALLVTALGVWLCVQSLPRE